MERPVDPRVIDRLLRDVSETEAEELSCSECFDLLSPGVELDLAGSTSAPMLIRLVHHLRQCGVCREEFETLRDLLRSAPEEPDDRT
ncbi:MAG TPA: hypothetical protein VFD71_17745 [Planctomycetota bacterium]|nr:hypothetical protein [Planctomycetota bacterium]